MHVIEVHRVFKKKYRTLQSKSKQQTYDQRCRNRTGACTAQWGMAEEEAEITSLSEERSWETSEEKKKQRAHSAKGLQTILPERIWRSWERNRDSWERNRDSWERMQKTWERMWQSSHSLPRSPVSLREISFTQLQSLTTQWITESTTKNHHSSGNGNREPEHSRTLSSSRHGGRHWRGGEECSEADGNWW